MKMKKNSPNTLSDENKVILYIRGELMPDNEQWFSSKFFINYYSNITLFYIQSIQLILISDNKQCFLSDFQYIASKKSLV